MQEKNFDNKIYLAEKAFTDGNHEETLAILNKILETDPGSTDALLIRAKVYYRHQNWSKALNDLNYLLEKQPENIIAQNYKSMVLDIVKFWNKDNFNP
ncbi:MAG: tetratricopeptide repeat protein [Prolixibacteraceae bacterium]|nr:tetratricopeptide repeat protein [Prolixibacteraceae bacterium]